MKKFVFSIANFPRKKLFVLLLISLTVFISSTGSVFAADTKAVTGSIWQGETVSPDEAVSSVEVKDDIDSIVFDVEAADVSVKRTLRANISYTYNSDKYTVKSGVNKKELTLAITSMPNTNKINTGSVFVYIPSGVDYKKISIDCEASAFSLCPIDTEFDIDVEASAFSFIIPQKLTHNIDYEADASASTMMFEKGATDFALYFEQENSNCAIEAKFKAKDKKPVIMGNGSAKIKVSVDVSTFSMLEKSKDELKAIQSDNKGFNKTGTVYSEQVLRKGCISLTEKASCTLNAKWEGDTKLQAIAVWDGDIEGKAFTLNNGTPTSFSAPKDGNYTIYLINAGGKKATNVSFDIKI